MTNILVLCTGNSCRSQIAEGFIKHFSGEDVNVLSAGIEIHGVNPRAIATMQEAGIDISHHTSNHIDEYADVKFDYVITVCDHANESCPVFPSHAIKIHQNFNDPAKARGTEEEITNAFRKVRDEIRDFSRDFVKKYIANS
jgi:arsenate reductase (thioredoxin)